MPLSIIGDFNHVILYEMGIHAQKKQWILHARFLDQVDPPPPAKDASFLTGRATV